MFNEKNQKWPIELMDVLAINHSLILMKISYISHIKHGAMRVFTMTDHEEKCFDFLEFFNFYHKTLR